MFRYLTPMYQIKLSPYAKIFYTEWLLNPCSHHYNMCADQILYGELDIAGLKSALKRYVSEHVVLNSHIREINGEPYLEKNNFILELEYVDHPIESFELWNYISRGFSLSEGPLYRFKLAKIRDGAYRLIVVLHHIVVSGASTNSFFEEVSHYYNDENYIARYSIEQQIDLISNLTNTLSERIERNKNKHKEFWDKQLLDIEPVNLIFLQLRSSPVEESNPIGEIRFNYTETELTKLNQIKRHYIITPYIYSLCIFAFLLSRYANQERLAISYPTAIKEAMDFIYGAQVNTNLISYQFDTNTTIADLFAQSRIFFNSLKERNINYGYCPIMSIIQGKNSSLLNIIFPQMPFKDMPFNFQGITKIEIQNEFNIDSADYFIFEQDSNNCLHYRVRYNKEKIDQELINNFVNCYQRLFLEILEDLVNGNDQKPLSKYSLLSPQQYQQIIYEVNNTEKCYPCDKTIHQLFEEQALRVPDKIAIVCEDITLTYQELNQKANLLANYLLNNYAIKPDDLVVLCADRSEWILIGILAILKTGGAYVPIDPDYPDNRINYILADTKTKVILTNKVYKKRLQAISKSSLVQSDVITIDSAVLKNKIAKQKSTNPVTATNSSNLIYAIYTSGTTGKPKGVMIEHESVINYISSIAPKYNDINNVDFSGNMVFDLTVTTTLFPLLTGKTIFIYGSELRDINDYVAHINENHIQFIKSTPNVLLNIPYESINKQLEICMVGGEKLTVKIASYILRFAKKVVDEYGPTETTVGATSSLILHDFQELNIGKPYANYTIYILNEKHLYPLPIGAVGELFIGGAGVARGYLNQPELTAEKFINNPFQTNEEKKQNKNSRLYKTGDLVRMLPGGNLEYIGRNDSQVKIRGYRIELGEVENQLLNYPGIKQAIVLARENANELSRYLNDKYLAAYYIADKKLDEVRIYNYLGKKLPEYMLPSMLIYLNRLPLTLNGKLDRAALPESNFEIDESYVAPRNKQEQLICDAFIKVLEIKKVGINDDFFKLGGHSLKAIALVSNLQNIFEIKVAHIFNLRTPKRLAENLEFGRNFLQDRLEQVKQAHLCHSRGGGNPTQGESGTSITSMATGSSNPFGDDNLCSKKPIRTVLLTGSTGYLGCNILNQLLKLTDYQIYLLIRANSQQEAIDRINHKFKFYFDKTLIDVIEKRVFIIKSNIERDYLGLSPKEYEKLISKIDSIIHVAALVKHYGNYEDFYSANVQATINLLELSKLTKQKDFHYISTTGVLYAQKKDNQYPYTEDDLPEISETLDNFYTQTKLQGEHQVIKYREQRINSNIYRVGNLAFMLENYRAQENIDDNAFYNWLKYLFTIKCSTESINTQEISQTDSTAEAIVKIFDKESLSNKTYHVFNPNLFDMTEVIKNKGFAILPLDSFIDRILQQLQHRNDYDLVIKFMLRNGWLDRMERQNSFFLNVCQEKTQRVLKWLAFDWPLITDEMFGNYIELLK